MQLPGGSSLGGGTGPGDRGLGREIGGQEQGERNVFDDGLMNDDVLLEIITAFAQRARAAGFPPYK
jgi:hypothetical protein